MRKHSRLLLLKAGAKYFFNWSVLRWIFFYFATYKPLPLLLFSSQHFTTTIILLLFSHGHENEEKFSSFFPSSLNRRHTQKMLLYFIIVQKKGIKLHQGTCSLDEWTCIYGRVEGIVVRKKCRKKNGARHEVAN